MIINTSALIAILRAEPEAVACAHAIEHAAVRRISAANWLEAAAVIDAIHDPIASRRFDDLVREAECVIEPITEAQARIAREAFRDFGTAGTPVLALQAPVVQPAYLAGPRRSFRFSQQPTQRSNQ